MGTTARALVYSGPGQARIETVDLAQSGTTVRTLCSGLSRGTERLVFNGQVPPEEFTRMRAPLQVGEFPFPVRYGYACVGTAIDGALAGQPVFCLHPHQDSFRADPAMLVPVPETVPPERAVLAANMETALNAVWDASLRPGARCLVVGAGLVGWLITALLSRRLDLSVVLTDIRPETGVKADDFSVSYVTPCAVPVQGFDVAFHTSASDAGLQTALDALDFEGRVIELSWFGSHPVQVALGSNFHANRLSIISSQVGHVARPRRAAYGYSDRMALALQALDDSRLDALITEDVQFRDLPAALPRLLGPGAPGIATRIVYE